MRRWPASEVSAIPSANRGIRWQRRDTSAEEVFFEFCWPAAVVQCFPIRCPPKEVRVTIKVLVGRGRAAERLRRTACELAADFLWAMRGRLCGPLVSTRPQTANRPALPPLRWSDSCRRCTWPVSAASLSPCPASSHSRSNQWAEMQPVGSGLPLPWLVEQFLQAVRCTRASLISISADLGESSGKALVLPTGCSGCFVA